MKFKNLGKVGVSLLLSSLFFTGCSASDFSDYLYGDNYSDSIVEEDSSWDSSILMEDDDEYLLDDESEDDVNFSELTIDEDTDIYVASTQDAVLADLVYTGDPWVSVGTGEASFTAEEIAKAADSYEYYGDLDELGRCTIAVASVGQDLMPTEKRGTISNVFPTGWSQAQYDNVSGKNLYNRCHLIGFQLTGENANKKNLITGTRYLNIDGMLSFENLIADYVKETDNHVLYRVTPIFKDDELLARGVHMEAYSIEDSGEGVNFDVFAFNVQPGISLNYADGTSQLEG